MGLDALDKYEGKQFTDCKEAHGQVCPKCGKNLATAEDYYGGGSHYWVLVCVPCNTRYTYDTYSFKVREWPHHEKCQTCCSLDLVCSEGSYLDSNGECKYWLPAPPPQTEMKRMESSSVGNRIQP